MSQIVFTGIADNYPLPTTLVQVNFAQGQVSSGTNVYSALLVGNKLPLSNGTGVAGVDGYLYGPLSSQPLQTVQDAITLFGAGSELHIMYRDFVLRNPSTPVFAAPVAESSGSKATLSLTFVGATATAAGTVRVFTPEGPIDTGFATGDLIATICANVVSNVNGNTNLPFVASTVSPTVTLTAKQKGLRGNLLRGGVLVIGAGTGLTVSSPALGFVSFLSGGTTADTNANVITYLEGLSQRFYYIVSAAEDQTQFSAISSMVSLMALPITGIRQRCFAGSNAVLGTATAVSTAVNSPRAEIVWMQNSDLAPSRLAAIAAAAYSAEEASLGGIYSVNFNFFGSNPATAALWNVPAPLDGSSPSQSSKVTALNTGVTPLVPTSGGNTQILRRVTCYFLNGAVNDYRCRDASQVTICDFFADDVATAATLQFGGKVIGNDPAPNQSVPVSVVTPRMYGSLIRNFLSQYSNRGLIQNLPATLLGMNVIREVSPGTRLSAEVPLQPSEILNQIGLVVDQTTPSQ